MKTKVAVITSLHPRDDSRINSKISNSLSKEYETHLFVIDGLGDDFSGNFKIHDCFYSPQIKRIYFRPFWKRKAKKFQYSLKGKIKKYLGKMKKFLGKVDKKHKKRYLSIITYTKNYEILRIFLLFIALIRLLLSFIFFTIKTLTFFLSYVFSFFLRPCFGLIKLIQEFLVDIVKIMWRLFRFPVSIILNYIYIYKSTKILDFDIFHLHDPELIYLGLFYKLIGKKVIYDSHESLPEQILSKTYFNHKFSNSLVKYTLSWMTYFNEFLFLRFFDGLIAATPKIKKDLLKINSFCEVINNYVILNELSPSKITPSSNKILYIGSVSVIKGVGDNIAMMKYVSNKNIKIDIVGRISNSIIPYYKKNRSKNIKFHGKVSRDQLKPFFSNAFVGLCLFHPVPNYIESQPIKLYEYMAAGIPVVVSDFPVWKKFIDENKCGFYVSHSDYKATATIIDTLYKNKKLTQKLGRNARRAIELKYNWGFEEKKLLAFYRKILHKRTKN